MTHIYIYITNYIIYIIYIKAKRYQNAEESVIMPSHLYRVSASVYPKILVGAVHDFDFKLLDHNVVVCVRSTSFTKYVMLRAP